MHSSMAPRKGHSLSFVLCIILLLHVFNAAVNSTPAPVHSGKGGHKTVTSCGGAFKADRGIILTPNYPALYDAQTTCQWTISVNKSHVIKLTFYTPFDLEPGPGCEFDNVQVFDVMEDGTWNQRGTWCGTTPPPEITSSTSNMVVVFNSDYKTTYKGFSGSWESVVSCGGIFSTTQGEIISPDYPNYYPHNLHCRWDVSVPNATFISLNFHGAMNLDVTADGVCGQDVVEIFDSFGNGTLISRGKFCGTQAPPLVQSHGSRMVIEFRSDNSFQNKDGTGFRANWSASPGCSHQSTAQSGYLMSYDYDPSTNHSDSSSTPACYWKMEAPGHDPSQFHVRLAFDTSSHSLQCADFLVTDASHTNVSLCSVIVNNTVTSSGHDMTIEYQPMADNYSHPFLAFWEVVCGGLLTASSGTIKTPEFPMGYPSNLDCLWEIRDSDPRQHFIKLEFDPVFDIEFNNPNCGSDYVQVLSALPSHAPIALTTTCGMTPPPPQVSYFSPMFVAFHSDGTKSHKGFSAKWTSGNGCYDAIRGEAGVLSFPNINYTYPSNYACTWDIHVPDNYVVKMDVLPGFELERVSDTLKVYDILPSGAHQQMTTLTGFLSTQTLMSRFSGVRLVFQSDNSVNYKGFQIKWSASCGGVFDTSSGNLSSPSYGSRDYLNDLDCTWRINVPIHHSIHLDFRSPFELEATNNVTCPYDHVEVFDAMSDGHLVSQGRFCGHNTPPPLVLDISSTVIKFHTDGDKTGKGFGLNWDSACGNTYSTNQGDVKSPNFPNPYPNNFDCRWEIDVKPGNVIRLAFQQPFSLESDDNCRYDYVEVFDYDVEGKEIKMGHWCGSNMPPLQLSTGNHMVVKFHSDKGKNGQGFHAKYEAVCGDVFYSWQGNFSSPLYPHGYPGDMDCRWEINLDPGQRVQLTFDTEFDLELNRFDCGYDDVQVFDSFSNQSLISNGRWCGQNRPPVITSFNERLVVLFHSDVNKDGKGFAVSWVAVPGCGGVYDRDSGYLMSTNFPDLYPNDVYCQWAIKPRDGSKNNITLTFDPVFQMESGKSCEYDFVEVTDGTTKIGRYCGKAAPPALTSLTGQMVIRFSSDKSNSGQGFFASWTAT